eukprot:2794103-Rhodomonas_salina.3
MKRIKSLRCAMSVPDTEQRERSKLQEGEKREGEEEGTGREWLMQRGEGCLAQAKERNETP